MSDPANGARHDPSTPPHLSTTGSTSMHPKSHPSAVGARHRIAPRLVLASALLMLVAACGGGDGGDESTTVLPAVKSWHSEAPISTDTGSASEPQLAFAPDGQAMAVWTERSGGQDSVWASRYAASTGWSVPALVETYHFDDANSPRIAIGASGNAHAVWVQTDLPQKNIWANRYDAATGTWGMAELIETTDDGPASSPRIAVGPGGHAMAVWTQFNAGRWNIWANRYDAATEAWGTAELIETDDAGYANFPQVALDANGNALAVWSQSDGLRDNLWANRFTAATGSWGAAEMIETVDIDSASTPQAGFDASGNALAVWSQSDGVRNSIWANRYSATTGTWGSARLIEVEDAGTAVSLGLSVNASGDAMAVWKQRDGARFSVWANRFNAASGTWDAAQLIETDDSGNADRPQVVMDGSGRALAVWQQEGTRSIDIWANRYDPATRSWGTPELIETDDAGDAFQPQIGVDSAGQAMAVWSQFDGTRSRVFANRYE